MSYKSGGRSGAFLVEIIVVILFFSIASAITLRLFVTAHTQSELSMNTNMAISKVEATAESLHATDDLAAAVSAVAASCEADVSGHYVAYFDKDWKAPADATKRAFVLEVIPTEQKLTSGKLTTAVIAVRKQDSEEPLYSLEVKKYTSEK